MAQITAKMVGDLRKKTGAGMMDCKKALAEANGDEKEAICLLHEAGHKMPTAVFADAFWYRRNAWDIPPCPGL